MGTWKVKNKQKNRQTKKQALNYRKQTDVIRREVGVGDKLRK